MELLDADIRLRIDSTTLVALEKEAQRRGVKPSWLAREILRQHVSGQTDTIRLPAITFTGKGDEIGKAFPDVEVKS